MEIRGIIHCHSTYSYDAKLSLPDLKTLCIEKGIQFVCMTEHADEMTEESGDAFVRECEALSDESFLFIPGFEVPYEHAHILMIGKRTFHETYARTIEMLRAWREDAGFVVLAHPVRNAFKVSEELLHEIDALEVWNQQYEGKRVPRTRSLTLFDTLQKQKKTLVATGGVDFHRVEHMGAPFITLNIPTLTEVSILEKLRMGSFRIHSPQASFHGVLSNVAQLKKTHRLASSFSVFVIIVGKRMNAFFAYFGISFPKWLTQFVRKRL